MIITDSGLFSAGVIVSVFSSPCQRQSELLPSLGIRHFGSFGQTVSKEKNLKNQPIRNNNRLWWPCLSMDRDE
jgi:hypothetical protein